jgi:hypothetical protein
VTYAAWYGSNSSFIPSLGWFWTLRGYQTRGACADNCIVEEWYLSLIAAIKAEKGVARDSAPLTAVSYQNGLLAIENRRHSSIDLTDLLGRTLRSWRFARGVAEGALSLNVSDLPDGVYFVHLRGDGIEEEMRKVSMVRR